MIAPTSFDPVLIDLRPEADFLRAHHAKAASLPYQTLFERMHELPPMAQPLRLITRAADHQEAEAFFQLKKRPVAEWMLWDNNLEKHWAQRGWLRQGPSSLYHWQASEVLQRFLALKPPLATNRLALDIGCGAGRDSVTLAKAGYQVRALDHNPDALARASQLAARFGQRIETQACALEQANALASIPDASVALILVCRYLHRPLFPVFQRLIAPGGYLLYQTFSEGCQRLGGPKNPQFILQPNELGEVFGQQRIVLDQAHQLSDGRPMRLFIAQWR